MTAAKRRPRARTIPKRKWAPGPWHDEPDFVAFQHAGLRCFIVRNTWVTGSLCGYVALPSTHPWWGKDYSECAAIPRCEPDPPPNFDEWPEAMRPQQGSYWRASMLESRWSCDHTPQSILEAHGGITYAGPAFWPNPPDDLDWGFGFDTGHCFDVMPLMDATMKAVYLAKDPSGREWAAHEAVFRDVEFGLQSVYRDLAYVRAETERLAEQLAVIGAVPRVGGDNAASEA